MILKISIIKNQAMVNQSNGKTIAIIFPYSYDPTLGGVQRSTNQLGLYFISQGYKVYFVSLHYDGHVKPNAGVLKYPDKINILDNLVLLTAYLGDVFVECSPDIVINQVAAEMVLVKSLHAIRMQGHHFKIISCFRNDPGMFRRHGAYIIRQKYSGGKYLDNVINSFIALLIIKFIHRIKWAYGFKEILDKSDKLMLLSSEFIKEIRWFVWGYKKEKIISIPNGFRIKSCTENKKKHILYVGRLDDKQKNIFLIPVLWSKIYMSLQDWELHVVGDGADAYQMRKIAEEYNLDRIYFHGKDFPDSFYDKAKIFIMTSVFEGFGNTLIEAQMFGVVPVVFNSYSALKGILNDGKDAIFVNPFNLGVFAEKVVTLAQNEEMWYEMSSAAKINAMRFSEDKIGAVWDDMIYELLNEL